MVHLTQTTQEKKKKCYPVRKCHFKEHQIFSSCKVYIGLAYISEWMHLTQKKKHFYAGTRMLTARFTRIAVLLEF